MRAVGIVFSNIHDNSIPELVRVRTLGSIPFGGRYRLIDFPLSNMVNSGIDTVGVITKSNYQSLMDHVGSGKDWDLARKNGGLIFLPPYGNSESNTLYSSRLEALKGITGFLSRADEEYVVMSDCDSICRINFNDVIDEHIANHADITLVYKKLVPNSAWESKVTILNLEQDGRINSARISDPNSEKEENLFINIFIMKRTLLLNVVMDSIARGKSNFILDVIASNLQSMKVYGYEHKGFYTGVKSLLSYYKSNMAMLYYDTRSEIFGDRSVFTKIRDSAPTKYGNSSIVKNSIIADGCVIEGEVENSIIFRNVKISRGAVVKNSIIMQNTQIGENCTINCIITDKDVTVKDKRVLSGSENHPFYIGKHMMI